MHCRLGCGIIKKKGQAYSELRKSYVIFICTFDPFDENFGLYTFSTICNEANHIVLDDGVTRVFLNVAGDRHRVSKELVSLMDYINEGKVSDEYTKELEDAVEALREDDGSEALYMTYQQTIMEHETRARNEATKNTIIKNVAELMKNMKWSAEQAMRALGIPEKDFPEYICQL